MPDFKETWFSALFSLTKAHKILIALGVTFIIVIIVILLVKIVNFIKTCFVNNYVFDLLDSEKVKNLCYKLLNGKMDIVFASPGDPLLFSFDEEKLAMVHARDRWIVNIILNDETTLLFFAIYQKLTLLEFGLEMKVSDTEAIQLVQDSRFFGDGVRGFQHLKLLGNSSDNTDFGNKIKVYFYPCFSRTLQKLVFLLHEITFLLQKKYIDRINQQIMEYKDD